MLTPMRPGLKPGLSRNLYAAACFMASYALLTGHRLLLVAHGEGFLIARVSRKEKFPHNENRVVWGTLSNSEKTSRYCTAPLKPKPGLNGPPRRVGGPPRGSRIYLIAHSSLLPEKSPALASGASDVTSARSYELTS